MKLKKHQINNKSTEKNHENYNALTNPKYQILQSCMITLIQKYFPLLQKLNIDLIKNQKLSFLIALIFKFSWTNIYFFTN